MSRRRGGKCLVSFAAEGLRLPAVLCAAVERHRLQDDSEGHPFACIIPEEVRTNLYSLAYGTVQTQTGQA